MGSKEEISSPLYERIVVKRPIHRFLDIIIISLLVCLLIYRVKSLVDEENKQHGFAWILGFVCESWFTFVWLLTVNTKWTPVEHITHPERLSQWADEIPPVDVFITTADPMLEPPIITVNTVISVLALDYPPHKLSCYVSDDGCSSHTYYSLIEASKFANFWVPFCHKYGVQVRAPSMYFIANSTSSSTSGSDQHNSLKFKQEWKIMKDEYEKLIRKIEDFPKKSTSSELSGDLAVFFSNVERRNHPSIVKVIRENKSRENPDALPHLIYISREKRPKYPHHYKAGAMNVLTRVSGVMTNAPFLLNLDCDMYVNNPQIVRHAMCLLLGSQFQEDEELGFVQSPQNFYDAPEGHPLTVLQKYVGQGLGGIQGPLYGGTGCFHRRKIIYGLWPADKDIRDDEAKVLTSANAEEKHLEEIFGSSKALIKSAADALQGKTSTPKPLQNLAEAAVQVAHCSYEIGTGWGTPVGWQYGSVAEDILTGAWIHSRGWRSAYCTPDPLPFLGCSPHGGPEVMTQQKRWAAGLLEVLLSRKSPIVGYFTAKMHLRQCLAYTTILIWGIRSIPELCYALLPAYSIITNSKFLPKVGEPAMYIYVALFLIYNFYTLLEYLETGISVKTWLLTQMMSRIVSINAFLFGVFNAIFKIIGISDTVFEITQKNPSISSNGDDDDDGQLTFDGSPVFLPGTTLLLVQLAALIMGLFGLRRPAHEGEGSGAEEVAGCVMVVLCFWPFVQGLFRKGKYGIPFPTIFKSTLLAMLFAHLCIRT